MDGRKDVIKLVVAIRLAKASKREYKASRLRIQGITAQNTKCHNSEYEVSHLKMQRLTSQNAKCHISEYKASHLKMQRVTSQNAKCHVSEYKESQFRRPNLNFHLREKTSYNAARRWEKQT